MERKLIHTSAVIFTGAADMVPRPRNACGDLAVRGLLTLTGC